MSEGAWSQVELDKLVEIKHGFAFAGEYFRDEPTRHVLLTPGNFAVGGGFKADKLKYYDGPVAEDFTLHPGDLLVTMTDLSKATDTLGYPAIVPKTSGQTYLHNQRLGLVRIRDKAVVDKRFLFYCLCSKSYRDEVLAGATGTTVKHTSPERIKRFRVALPPVSVQAAIGRVLGSLDDKIDLNRCMNETLEHMARATFKSWFVDFDPVRAKAEGRQPAGIDADTAALFPSTFSPSSFGPMPTGWHAGRLDDCLILQRGFDLPEAQRRPGDHPVIAAGGVNGTHDEFKIQGPGVTTGRSGVLGRVYYVEQDFWPLNTSLYVREYRNFAPAHAYFLLGSLDFGTFNAGSAVPTLSRNHVHNLPVVVPPKSVVSAFEKHAGSGLGYSCMAGPDIAPPEMLAERSSYEQVVLAGRLRGAIERLNPGIPADAREEAVRKVLRAEHPTLVANNRAFHRMLVDGVDVEYARGDGTIAGDKSRLVDFDDLEANDWLAVNQFTVIDGQHNRRPDVVVFVNGLPLAVIELKNPADEDATIWKAFQQLQTYKKQIPDLFVYNEALIASDGLEARVGSLTADRERFMPWRTIEGQDVAPATMLQLEVLVRGMFERRRFLDLIRYGVVFDRDSKDRTMKVLAGYHQFHAVGAAVEATVAASRPEGDRRCGVVWHTQGSGKSLTMVFFAGRIILHPAMENPTIVVLTDRNDLDGQLFDTFARCQELLRQTPVQAANRAHLRELLAVGSGGVVFTTIQKFFPEEKGDRYPLLSERRNIVVVADEAHRSQYDFIDGFARHMRDALPNASFIGFTGTPIELSDKNTKAVFGEYISIYDIQRAVQDGATVPIYYESRFAKLELNASEMPKVDAEFEEVTETEEDQRKEKLKTKWAALEAVVGAEKRINLIAEDLVRHFEARLEAMDGKA